MLRTRATASSRYALSYAEQAAGRIQLPWLCPVLAQPHHSERHHRTITTRPTISRSKTLPAPVTQSRHLASPAAVPDSFDRGDDYIPFAYRHSDHSLTRDPRLPQNADLSPFDLSQILMLDAAELPEDSIDTHGGAIRNIDEIEATLDACLQVHRWDRAFALLSQLSLFCQHNPVRLRNSFNRVLAALVDDLIWNRNGEHEKRINEWIEVHMRKADLEPDAHTFALKLKAALETLIGSKRDRTVRRYWDMTKRYALESRVLGMREVLDDRDLGRLSEICTLDVATPRLESTTITFRPDASALPEASDKEEAHIRETEQKGLGLSSLRQSLSLFSEQTRNATDSTPTEDHLAQRQRRLERDAIQSALDRWKTEFQKRARMGVMPTDLAYGEIGALLWQWHEMLAEKIRHEIKLAREEDLLPGTKTAQQKLRAECTPFLELLQPEHVAAITSIALMQIMSKFGATKSIKLVKLVTALGQLLEHEYNATTTNQRKSAFYKAARKAAKGQGGLGPFLEAAESMETHLYRRSSHHAAKPFMYSPGWTKAIHGKIGAVLCELMFDTAKITVRRLDPTTGAMLSMPQPVFLHSTAYSNGKRVGVVSLHEDFVKILVTQPAEHLIAKQLPMVCPPKPWKSFRDGGYLESKQPFLRIKHNETAQKDYAIAAASRGDLDQLFAGVDVLGQTGWRINKNVFTVMLEAWNSGEEVANLPPLNKVFPDIDRPGENASPRDRWEWFSKMRAVDNEKSGLHSNRCFQNFQMEIAKAYLDETFYLPHNIDFRGRAYPIPPYLNQMGADNCRGLLLFDKGRELGAEGLRWLKIHLSNVYGYDKASLSDRAQFPMDHLSDIYDSVRNPLSGRRWWLGAEDPWQCLATCFELTNALDSPDPSKFMSRLPIHQDGSCNGLQHYAALGGDIAGARQVNLEPGEKPADVYTGVCELVKAEIKEDAANGDELAKALDGRVTRKVVKQTVMTNVYGVTFLGAIRQVRKQVESLIPEIEAAGQSGKAATYIARKIFKGLGALFSGAHEIQYWLGDCANRISSSISPAQQEKIYEDVFLSKHEAKASAGARRTNTKGKEVLESGTFRSPVIWTTPLKLPVVQPYRINKGQRIRTNLQSIMLAQPSAADSVNKRKQLQAFPPNFIHSLDATHMILSALKANEVGLSFSAVHDSFWTHAADVDTLNVLLRDAFIRMHSDDIVGRLAAEFNKRYDGHYYLAQINRNNALGRAIASYRRELVKAGVYPKGSGAKAVQQQRHVELAREVRKKKLMASEDPAERQEGQEMITAATLYEKHNGDRYLSTRDSLGETAIGMVPESAEIADEGVLDKALNSSEVASDIDLAGTLDPLRDSVANDHDEDAVDAGDHHSASDPSSSSHDINVFGQKVRKPKEQNKQGQNHQMWLWLPIKFRPVPQKGDFDVKRLKDSVYFFS
ncbi:DNA-directed RNA polymerase, mitochondrial [Cladophialophora carrionii]|uniref:DNA-directed RNA polymerase n=1 Tax=Cladophialophora carrionii TaxID=86049 RepID=A0A1C1C7E7_9EURO|nr:DNA-directed RNA polymerase, mitochondrial [Cladophialophora carrionii]